MTRANLVKISGGWAVVPVGKPMNAAHAMRIVATQAEARTGVDVAAVIA